MTIIAGRYTLDGQLGAGGMGTVYLGTDIITEDRVAIKHLHRDRSQVYPELIERFEREADALRALNHPNIVKALTRFEHDGDHYIVMEYVPGKDLADLMVREGVLSLERTVQIALGVVDALTRAHYLRITHRDLKPANILLDMDGTPRLTDFGVAYWEAKGRMTAAGLQIGTPAYMAPEIVNGETGDTRVDMWALGVMLFEMITGRHPFYEGASMNMMLINILTQQPPDIQLLRPDCPEALADLIYRMLEKDADARIGSARLAGAELEIIGQMLSERAMHRPAAPSRFAPDAEPPTALRHNLPAQPTPLVGRDAELRELTRMLESPDHRLITLTGPGGTGKTRLAIGAAQNLLNGVATTDPQFFQHGIYLVELAPLLSPEPLVPTLANALGFQFAAEGDPKSQLLDYLREKRLLLLMDNFEHVLDGVPLIAEILSAAPDVKVLATSRERLNLMAESVYALGGMELPADSFDIDALQQCGSVRLFVQSAHRADPAWKPEPADYPTIAAICRRVDALPLGIVLAAGWILTLTLDEIYAELGHSLDILESDMRDMPARHRSMRAVFDYSWQMLAAEERALLMKLSVFRGGFSRRAAQVVTDARLRPLAALVNKSLLRRDPDIGSYHMHELLRQFAEAKLAEQSPADEAGVDPTDARVKHSAYYLAAVSDARQRLESGGQVEALRDIDSDMENVRAAWQFAAAHGSPSALQPALPAQHLYFELRGQYADGIAFYRQIAAFLRARPASRERDEALGSVLAHAAAFAVTLHQADHVSACTAESRALLDDTTGDGRAALAFAEGLAHLTLHRPADGRPHFERAAAHYRTTGDRGALARTLAEWSSTYWFRAGADSDFDQARTLAEEALEIQRALGDAYGMANTLLRLGTIAYFRHDDDTDIRCTAESLTLFQRVGHRYGMADALSNIGVRDMMLGDYAASRENLERALAVKREIGTPLPIANAQFRLAALAYNEARFEESLAHADAGLAIVAGTVHREWELTLQLARGHALTALGRYKEAVRAYVRAHELARALGNAEDEAFALNRQGAALLHTDPAAARDCLSKALTQSETGGDATTAAVSQMLLAQIALARGDAAAAADQHAPAAAYFADRAGWVINYTADIWQLNTWAIEAALTSAEIAAANDGAPLPALRDALDAAGKAFSPAHARKAVAAAARLLSTTQPELAARLAAAVVHDSRAYAADRATAEKVLATLGPPENPFESFEQAAAAVRSAAD